ncbi:hypothetical protein A3K64_02515 [Candidatus Micrarchaeota archaeon RBG_16_36_9]|nr:MAG: hypothetical protein A3K64_02515 [Candidatus Micrarchaeota archaeon RBG_16_36_9]
MDWMIFVKRENVRKSEEKLRSDFNLAAKQAITVRDAKSLEIDKDGSFFLITGTDEGVAKCKELIKEFVENIDEKYFDTAKKKLQEEVDKAAEGFGGLF